MRLNPRHLSKKLPRTLLATGCVAVVVATIFAFPQDDGGELVGGDDNPLVARKLGAVIAGLEEQLWLNEELIETAVRAYRRAALPRGAASEALEK